MKKVEWVECVIIAKVEWVIIEVECVIIAKVEWVLNEVEWVINEVEWVINAKVEWVMDWVKKYALEVPHDEKMEIVFSFDF